MTICPNCNKQLADGVKFCNACGTPITETVFCRNCGAKISADAAFCKNCGAATVKNEPEVVNYSAQAVVENVNPVQDEKAVDPQPQVVPIAKPKRKVSKKFVAVCCSIVAVIVAATIILLTLFGGGVNNYGLYIKNNQMYYTDISGDEPLQITTELYEGAKVHIVETKSLMQGYAALSVITPGIKDMDALVGSAKTAAEGVIGCEVTRAVRDVTMGGLEIKEGDYIAITDGEINAVAGNAEDALMDALEASDTDLCELITVFVGKGVDEDRRVALTERLEETYPDCEVTLYNGGQDVYEFMVAVE